MRKLWQRLKSAAAVLFGRENAPDPIRGGKRQGLTKAKNTAKSKTTFIADTAKFITKRKASDGTSTAHFVTLNKDKKAFNPLLKKKEKSTPKTVKQKISPQKKELSIPVKKAIETKIMYQQNANPYEKSNIASDIKEVDFKAAASAAQINDIISTEYRRFASDIYSQEVL